VKRVGIVGLFATLLGASVYADEPPKPRFDLASEVAWARATWPGDFEGVLFGSPRAKLLSWVPPASSTTIYLFAPDYGCRRVALSRAAPDERSRETTGQALAGRIVGRPRVEEGRQVRDVEALVVDDLLQRDDDAASVEALEPEGKWRVAQSSGYGVEPTVYGALSYADDRVARFDGEPLALHAYCGGPTDWLSCPTGGERPCERCEQISLLFAEKNSLWGHSRNYGQRAVTCHDRCPAYPESPAKQRVEELAGHASLWRPRKAPLAKVPSLYKSRDDCRREHRLD
jgi:hypothetical protein